MIYYDYLHESDTYIVMLPSDMSMVPDAIINLLEIYGINTQSAAGRWISFSRRERFASKIIRKCRRTCIR